MPEFDVINHKSKEKRIRYLMLTLLDQCNLACKYCFETKEPRKDRTMDPAIAKKMITRYMEQEDRYSEVVIDFFGGEPFLAFPLIRDIVQWVRSKKWKKKYIFSIGTNGTLLTDEIKEWLIENQRYLSVGVSFDGTKKAHDLSRDNSYDRVSKNLPFFTRHWPRQPIKMTICAETIPYVARGIIEMEEKKIPFTANVAFEDIWGSPTEKQTLLNTYADQLSRLVDYYAARPTLYPPTLLDRKIEYMITDDIDTGGDPGDKVTRFCGAGHEMVVVDVDGKIHPCHRFFPWISGRGDSTEKQNHQSQWLPQECNACKLLPLCPTCAGHNFELNGDSAVRSTYHCESLKLEVLASTKLRALAIEREKTKIDTLPQNSINLMKRQIDAILDIDKNGI